jgi:hypothetical protein
VTEATPVPTKRRRLDCHRAASLAQADRLRARAERHTTGKATRARVTPPNVGPAQAVTEGTKRQALGARSLEPRSLRKESRIATRAFTIQNTQRFVDDHEDAKE